MGDGPHFNLEAANGYLGFEPGSRWLTAEDCPIARCDFRKPGSSKPVWRWRRVDLDAFAASRVVQPGFRSPF